MLTPFENDWAMEEIIGAARCGKNEAEFHVQVGMDEFCFQKIAERTYYDEDDESDQLDEEWSIQLWTNALLFDDALNGMDYSGYCVAYSASYMEFIEGNAYWQKKRKKNPFGAEAYRQHYIQAREVLQKELERKTFFTKKPIHNLSEMLRHAVDALDILRENSEVLEQMKAAGKADEFRREIAALQERLRKHI